jgi:non-heme chloroperoxidase
VRASTLKHVLLGLIAFGGVATISTTASAEFVKVSDDLTIHYERSGHGPTTVVLVPGWTMDTEVFSKQLEHFRDSDKFTVIAFDPRSQGQSTHTLEGNFYEQHGRDLNAFVGALKLEGIVLAGWSCGGFDALSYVHQFGASNLKGLIMIDAPPKATGDDNSKDSSEWVWFNKSDSDGAKKWFTQGALLDRQKLNEDFGAWMVDSPTPEYMKWIVAMSNQTGDGVAALLNESTAYQDYEEDLKALNGKLPLLYYVSDEGTKVQNWSNGNTPTATVVRFGKHLSFWEHPDVFNKALESFAVALK